MKGERNLRNAGYVWDIFAYFMCNAQGVRVGRRLTEAGADRYAKLFAKRNKVQTTIRLTR